MNIQDIFMEEIHTDTVRSINPLAMLRKDSLMNRTERECRFRIQEEDEKHKLAAITTKQETDGLIFHRPKQGYDSYASCTAQTLRQCRIVHRFFDLKLKPMKD